MEDLVVTVQQQKGVPNILLDSLSYIILNIKFGLMLDTLTLTNGCNIRHSKKNSYNDTFGENYENVAQTLDYTSSLQETLLT